VQLLAGSIMIGKYASGEPALSRHSIKWIEMLGEYLLNTLRVFAMYSIVVTATWIE